MRFARVRAGSADHSRLSTNETSPACSSTFLGLTLPCTNPARCKDRKPAQQLVSHRPTPATTSGAAKALGRAAEGASVIEPDRYTRQVKLAIANAFQIPRRSDVADLAP